MKIEEYVIECPKCYHLILETRPLKLIVVGIECEFCIGYIIEKKEIERQLKETIKE